MSAKHIAMTAELREGTGKGTARALRREKKLPAVIYGNNQSPVSIVLDEKNITLEYHKGHLFTTLVDITVDGKKELVLARDVQTHVVTDAVIHVDFLRVSAKTKIAVMVPVHFEGHEESPALKAKGILNVVRHEVELLCTATEIPEVLTVNLAGKEFGDSVRLSDATMPNGVSAVINDRDFTIATIVEPKVVSEDDEEDTGAPEASDVPAENGGDDAEEENK